MRLQQLKTRRGAIELPSFFPDGTRGVVKSIDAQDIQACGIQGLMVNSFHLANAPGINTLKTLGGIHAFSGWSGPVMSDSGGFQAFSLIHESGLGTISAKGLFYRLDKQQKKKQLTPEKAIHNQLKLGADIIYCLDDCTHPDLPLSEQERSVKHTLAWAKTCKAYFQETTKKIEKPPLLFAIVQGGEQPALRKHCAQELLDMGFDGFGFGGWPINAQGGLVEMLAYVSELIPNHYPKHALGVGRPDNLVAACRAGYQIFDCVMPTRDARNKRLYTFKTSLPENQPLPADFYTTLYIDNEKLMKDDQPLEPGCDCHTCFHYSRAYLHHLFQLRDHLAYRLATIHNLRFYARLMQRLKDHG